MKNVFTFFNLKKAFLLAGLFFLGASVSYAQSNYTITFQDETIEMPENIGTFDWSQMPDYSALGGGYYGWIQFYETPSQAIQDSFKDRGLQLLNYIPHHTYLFYFPEDTNIAFLQDSGARSIVPVEARFKIGQRLKNGDIGEWAWDNNNNILVHLIHHDNVSRQYVLSELATHQITVTKTYENSNFLELAIPTNCLEDLATAPYVKWVEQIQAPSVPDDERGRALHRATWLESTTGTGLDYTGRGIGVMCRDDGNIGPHIDFTGRMNGLPEGDNGNNTHGDGVSGIMAGAGNINPNIAGMARGADLYAVFYVPTFLDGPTTGFINDGSVQITNSSFSNGCNDGYTAITEIVDTQLNDLPSVMHVFSAGNSNGNDCGYGAGSQWGNITGGHKQAKNCIATASVQFDGDLSGFSSRGPAHDGRIKPDIAAHGEGQNSTTRNQGYQVFGGTSAAAPGIAGIMAQLYELYEDQNSALPNAGLIKAAMLNTANDYGNEGPDYRFGWGVVNARRAGQLLLDDRFLSDNVTQGNSNTHTINVPANTKQVRFMVLWNDPAATPGANPALINDLDMLVQDPSSNTLQPWVLDPTPNPTTLNNPAVPGIDRLNNVEQVLINNPAAGDYDIEITGFNVPVGPQEYFVVYEIVEENLTLAYPNGGEKIFDPGPIHWDAINTTDPFTIDISYDNGANWENLGTAPADETNFFWVPTNTIQTGEALVRVTSGSFSDVSDATFTITQNDVLNNSAFQVTRVCETEATIEWEAYDGADGYNLYMLGDQYMEFVASTNTNSITIPITDPNDEMWFAVAPTNSVDGWEGQRNLAEFYAGGITNCELNTEEFALEQSITIFPNPASDVITIESLNSQSLINEIAIRNNLGQVLKTVPVENASVSVGINISEFATGLYFVEVKADNASVTKKLIIK